MNQPGNITASDDASQQQLMVESSPSSANNDDDGKDTNESSSSSQHYLEWKRKREERNNSNRNTTTTSSNKSSNHENRKEEEEENFDMDLIPTRKKHKLLKELTKNEQVESSNKSTASLLKKSRELKETQPQLTDLEKLEQKENELLKELMNQSFLSVVNNLTGDVNLKLNYGWTIPEYYKNLSVEQVEIIRKKFGIQIDGICVPPPVLTFEHLKLPKCLLKLLLEKNIETPTPIQMQGLPCLLEGRDVIGIAFTGSGKTLVFSLPIIMYSYLNEHLFQMVNHSLNGSSRMSSSKSSTSSMRNNGPLGLILCPNRELAKQTFEYIEYFFNGINEQQQHSFRNFKLNVSLCMGGIREERIFNTNNNNSNRSSGGGGGSRYYSSNTSGGGSSGDNNYIHVVVATPGRLIQMLNENKIQLNDCKYICMDEADRLIDLGFEEDIKTIFQHLNIAHSTTTTDNSKSDNSSNNSSNNPQHHIQKVFFSATMPEKIQNLAMNTLNQPIIVNVGRAGAVNLDVIQEVEYVQEEDKIVYLLQVLQKTPPPVLIFSQNKSEVDTICEYLLLKGVEAVSIHSSKDQQEREFAIDSFKQGKKHVLVATDIVSKGIDFPNVKHVINFDMPREIENYVHRIGRTGRNGKTGLSTTFINKNQSEQILLDLKYLLKEANQRIPPILLSIYDPYANMENVECKYCQGRGHRITECQKYHRDKQLQIQKALQSSTFGVE